MYQSTNPRRYQSSYGRDLYKSNYNYQGSQQTTPTNYNSNSSLVDQRSAKYMNTPNERNVPNRQFSYSKDLFDFNVYKRWISELLEFYKEDVLLAKEKVNLLHLVISEQVVGKLNNEDGENFIVELKKSFEGKLNKFLDTLQDGSPNTSLYVLKANILSFTDNKYMSSHMMRNESKQLNLEFISTYIKQKISTCVRDINSSFYQKNPTKYDPKLCSLLNKVIKLLNYLGRDVDMYNISDRFMLDLKEILVYLLSTQNYENFYSAHKLGKFVKLNSVHIRQNILSDEDFGSNIYARDDFIDMMNQIAQSHSNNSNSFPHVNVDTILRVKVAENLKEINEKYLSTLQKSFTQSFNTSTSDNYIKSSFNLLNVDKKDISVKYEKLKDFHDNLKNCYLKGVISKTENSEFQNYNSYQKPKSVYGNFITPASTIKNTPNKERTPNQFGLDFKENFSNAYKANDSSKYIKEILERTGPDVNADPEVSRVYQDICSSYFNSRYLQNMRSTLDNLDYCISFEKLVYIIVCIYHEIKDIFDMIDLFKNNEKNLYHKISEKVVTQTIDDLEDEFDYDNWDIFVVIDDLFNEISDQCKDYASENFQSNFGYSDQFNNEPYAQVERDRKYNSQPNFHERQAVPMQQPSNLSPSQMDESRNILKQMSGKINEMKANNEITADSKLFDQLQLTCKLMDMESNRDETSNNVIKSTIEVLKSEFERLENKAQVKKPEYEAFNNPIIFQQGLYIDNLNYVVKNLRATEFKLPIKLLIVNDSFEVIQLDKFDNQGNCIKCRILKSRTNADENTFATHPYVISTNGKMIAVYIPEKTLEPESIIKLVVDNNLGVKIHNFNDYLQKENLNEASLVDSSLPEMQFNEKLEKDKNVRQERERQEKAQIRQEQTKKEQDDWNKKQREQEELKNQQEEWARLQRDKEEEMLRQERLEEDRLRQIKLEEERYQRQKEEEQLRLRREKEGFERQQREEEERNRQEKLKEERLRNEREEQERIRKEKDLAIKKAEEARQQQRIEEEKARKEKEDQERIRRDQEEQDRQRKVEEERQKRLENERLQREEQERQRGLELEREQRKEEEKLQREQEEQQRKKRLEEEAFYFEQEEQKKQDRLEEERQQALENERQDRLEEERQQALENERQDRLEEERQQKLENEKLQREEEERQKMYEEEMLQREREEQESEERLENERLEREEQDRLEEERQQALENERQERLEREMEEQQRQKIHEEEQERLEQEKLYKLEEEKFEREEQEYQQKQLDERIEREEQERLEREEEKRMQIEKEQEEQQRQKIHEEEQERLEQEKLYKLEEEKFEREEQEYQQKQLDERIEREEQERLEREEEKRMQVEKEQEERQQIEEEQERLEKEQEKRMQVEKEQEERQQIEEEQERLEKEQEKRMQVEKEQQERQMIEEEQERLEKEKAERDNEFDQFDDEFDDQGDDDWGTEDVAIDTKDKKQENDIDDAFENAVNKPKDEEKQAQINMEDDDFDDQIEDDVDDFDDILDSPEKEVAKPEKNNNRPTSAMNEPVKEKAIAKQVFKSNDQSEATSNANEGDERDQPINIGKRLLKRDIIENLITEYIESTIPMPDEQINEMLQTMPITNETIDVQFQEYIKANHFFWYNFDVTMKIDQSIKECMFDETQEFVFEKDIDGLVEQTANYLREIITATTGRETINPKCLLLYPIISESYPEGEEEEEQEEPYFDFMLFAVSLEEQKVMLVSSNPEITEETIVQSEYHIKLGKFLLMCSNYMQVNEEKDLEGFMEQMDAIKAQPEDDVKSYLNIPTLTEVIYETITSLQNNHYQKLLICLNNMFYEPIGENFDIESQNINLVNADFNITNALRIIANMQACQYITGIFCFIYNFRN